MYFEIPESTDKGNNEYITKEYYPLTLYSLITNKVKKFTVKTDDGKGEMTRREKRM